MAAAATMEFEKPIVELERQIDELKRLAGDRQLSVTEEIAPLEKKLVEAEVAQDTPDPSDAVVVLDGHQAPARIIHIDRVHGPELVDRDETSRMAHTLLVEEDLAGAVEANGDRDDQPDDDEGSRPGAAGRREPSRDARARAAGARRGPDPAGGRRRVPL